MSRDEDELSASPAGSSGLLSGPANLKSTLTRVAQLAVQAMPNADGAGLTPLEPDRPKTVVGTGGFVTVVDDIQYRLDEGPCVSAIAEARTAPVGRNATKREDG